MVSWRSSSNRTDTLATAFVGVIAPDARTVRYCSSGHPPAFLRPEHGALKTLASTAPPLGIFAETVFASRTVDVIGPALLALYTDGSAALRKMNFAMRYFVEHSEVVAQRIVRIANVVGRERVIAGTDCGFATNPGGIPEIHPTIVWAKFAALVEGACLASENLWKRK